MAHLSECCEVGTGSSSYFGDEVTEVQRGYWLAQEHPAKKWQSQVKPVSDSGTVLTALLSWFWPSLRDYRKEIWPNPDHFSNLLWHFMSTICSCKVLILATWNWSWLPSFIEKILWLFLETWYPFPKIPFLLFTFFCTGSMGNFLKLAPFQKFSSKLGQNDSYGWLLLELVGLILSSRLPVGAA